VQTGILRNGKISNATFKQAKLVIGSISAERKVRQNHI